MADGANPAGNLLADRLNHLLRTAHPKDRGPCNHAEVAAAVNEAAGHNVISATYVWQMRGRRDDPTHKHLSALSRTKTAERRVRALAAGEDPHLFRPPRQLVPGRALAQQPGQLGDVRSFDPAPAMSTVRASGSVVLSQ
jgi:hypothetical protein